MTTLLFETPAKQRNWWLRFKAMAFLGGTNAFRSNAEARRSQRKRGDEDDCFFPALRLSVCSAPLRSIGKRRVALRATRPKRRQQSREVHEIDVGIAVDVALPARGNASSKKLQQ